MKDNELFDFLISEAEHPFSGWDFSYINNRFVEFPLTWSYSSKVLPLIRTSESLLDMGTGGGEMLATLSPLPRNTCATEGYEPNFSVAKNKLEPLGVKVVAPKNDGNLPFNNEEFELIINRHESYNPKEVHRVLKHEGIFITQQVGDNNNSKLRQLLAGTQASQNEGKWNLEYATNELETAGFEIIEGKQDITLTRIFDVGAIVYYLKAIPFDFPDFTVEKYYNKLEEINEYINNKGYLDLDMNNHRFIIKAKKA
ncbi:MAG: class I SAM-dependent methyltransferase [Promethearchaeota archaeon]|jgi:SAM-dependent methyltransferase